MKTTDFLQVALANQKRCRTGLRKLWSDWSKCEIKHGISTQRSEPTTFIHVPESACVSTVWRDVATRSSMTSNINKFLEPREISLDEASWSSALRRCSDRIGADSIRPSHLSVAVDALPSSSSSGYPFKVRRGHVRDLIFKEASKLSFDISRDRARVYPCFSASRRVIRERGINKPRLVWAYPAAVSALENKYCDAISSKIKTSLWHGNSMTWMSEGKWFTRFSNRGNITLSIDYSSFDSTVPSFVIRAAFRLLRQWFTLSAREEHELDFLISYFIHTPIVMYSETVQKHRGIPSGSCFTSIIGTLCNMLICEYVCHRIGSTILPSSLWLGDDSNLKISTYDGCKSEVLQKFSTASRELGLDVSEVKSKAYFPHDPIFSSFLSRDVQTAYPQLLFDYEKFVHQIFLPEDPDKNPSDALNRLVGLAYAYGHNHTAYGLLSRCFSSVGSVFQPSPGIRRKYEKMLNITFDDTSWVFPNFESVHSMYYGYA